MCINPIKANNMLVVSSRISFSSQLRVFSRDSQNIWMLAYHMIIFCTHEYISHITRVEIHARDVITGPACSSNADLGKGDRSAFSEPEILRENAPRRKCAA